MLRKTLNRKKNTLQYISVGLIKASQIKNVLIIGCNSSIITHLKKSLRDTPNIFLHDSTNSRDDELKVVIESLKQSLSNKKVKHETLHLVLGGEVDTIDSVEESIENESPCIFIAVSIIFFIFKKKIHFYTKIKVYNMINLFNYYYY